MGLELIVTTLTCILALLAHARGNSTFYLFNAYQDHTIWLGSISVTGILQDDNIELGKDQRAFCSFSGTWSESPVETQFSSIQWTLDGSDAFTHYDNVDISYSVFPQNAFSFLDISNIDLTTTGLLNCSISDTTNTYVAYVTWDLVVEGMYACKDNNTVMVL